MRMPAGATTIDPPRAAPPYSDPMKPIDSAVVAVAGLGTRLYPTSAAVPKEMLPVGRFPVLHHVLEELTAAGVCRILLVTNHTKPAIRDYVEGLPKLADRWREIDFQFVEQSIDPEVGKPAGTGDAVARAERFAADRDFLVAFGDSIVESERPGSLVARMARAHTARAAACCIAVARVRPEDVSRYGVVSPRTGEQLEDADAFALDGIVEKPPPERAPSHFAVSARYSFSPEIFATLRETEATAGGEVYLTHAIEALIDAGRTVCAVPLEDAERRRDIGNHASYFEAFVDFALADPDCGDDLARHLREALEPRPSERSLTP